MLERPITIYKKKKSEKAASGVHPAHPLVIKTCWCPANIQPSTTFNSLPQKWRFWFVLATHATGTRTFLIALITHFTSEEWIHSSTRTRQNGRKETKTKRRISYWWRHFTRMLASKMTTTSISITRIWIQINENIWIKSKTYKYIKY